MVQPKKGGKLRSPMIVLCNTIESVIKALYTHTQFSPISSNKFHLKFIYLFFFYLKNKIVGAAAPVDLPKKKKAFLIRPLFVSTVYANER